MFEIKYPKGKSICKVNFSVSVDGVGAGRDVRVLGDFNNWSWMDGLKLKEGKKAYTGTMELPAAAATYQFRYRVDGDHWINDPAVDRTVGNTFGTANMVLQIEAGVTPAQRKKTAPTKQATAKKAPAKKAAPKQVAIKKEPSKQEPSKREPSKQVAVKKEPSKQAAAGPDNLKLIEGIGPKIEGLLAEAGIATFAALASAKPAQLKSVLAEAGPRYRLAKTDTWREQAKLAASGKMNELKKLQAELKGGIRK